LWALWRLLGPEVPPKFEGPQERPLDVPGRTVSVGRSEFLVREAGPPDGPPIVLLHGWLYDSLATWHRVLPHLSADRRVVMIDLHNHGKSDRTRGRFDIADAADEVALVLARLGLGGVPVVGYSMGGMVAMALVDRHPGLVSRMVLGGTAAHPVDRPRWLTVPIFLAGRAMARFDRLGLPRISHRYLLHVGAVERHHAAWLWDQLLDRDPDLYYESGFAILRFDFTDRAKFVEIPTMVMIPTRDQLVLPRVQYATAAAIPGAEIVEIVDAGHEAVLTHATEVAKAIREFVAG
jgi:pimeloyl-ACP methyl ester carboxylesterase